MPARKTMAGNDVVWKKDLEPGPDGLGSLYLG